MGLIDDLKEQAEKALEGAKAEAGEAAGRAALDQLKRRTASLLDGLVGDAEAELERARAEDAGRDKLALPEVDVGTPGWAKAGEEAFATANARPAAPRAPTARDREARAREELAALKAKLKGGG